MNDIESLLYDASLDTNESIISYLLEENEANAKVAAVGLGGILAASSRSLHNRRALFVRPQLDWDDHLFRVRSEGVGAFHKRYRMSEETFNKLAELLREPLAKDERQAYASSGHAAIGVTTALHCTLRWLAGAQVPDLVSYAGLCQTAVYKAIHRTTRAICELKALAICLPIDAQQLHAAAAGFRGGSHCDIIKGCVLALDGWLCQIQQPGEEEANGAVRCYFSGHYHKFGVNVQVAVDSRGRFVWVDVYGPGGTNDLTAYEGSALQEYVESLPIGYYAIGDNAYMPTEHFLTPFSGCQQGNPARSAFNYCLSQQRIKVEQTLGRLVAQWRIFRSPMQIALKHVGRTVMAACCLTNFIREHEPTEEDERSPHPSEWDDKGLHSRGYIPSDTVMSRRGNSTLREQMVQYIRDNDIRRPQWNLDRNAARLNALVGREQTVIAA
eukprot:GHVU01155692.1.p1 GENE.GHVU01155692.1~~GHVU01155692.1.p1  ORF type:complete len:441 (+),score=39.09 GHVU01155692.1:242-1564(+)